MKRDVLLKKVLMDCPLCDRVHEVEERLRTASMVIKDEEVDYEEHFFFAGMRMKKRMSLNPAL